MTLYAKAHAVLEAYGRLDDTHLALQRSVNDLYPECVPVLDCLDEASMALYELRNHVYDLMRLLGGERRSSSAGAFCCPFPTTRP